MLLSRLFDLPLTPDQERWVWLAGSVLLYIGVTNVAWAIRRFAARVRWSPAASVVVGLVRFAFYVGIPYAALLSGVVTLTSLGVVEMSHRESVDQGFLVAGGGVVLTALVGWYYRREVMALGEDAGPSLAVFRRDLSRPWGWVMVLLGVFYQQIHWAFYRALPFLLLDDRYVGAFLGLAIVLLEAYANPRTRRDLADPSGTEFLVLSAGFAVISTILFVLTGTSWLGAGAHLVTVVGLVLLLIRSRRRLQPEQP